MRALRRTVLCALALLTTHLVACADAPPAEPSAASTVPEAGDGGDVQRPPPCVPSPETCDGLDNDCDGVADDGLSGCDVCRPYHELPVVTHYDKASNGPRFLAADQVDLYAPQNGKGYVPGQCYPIYASSRMPDIDHYPGDTWSTSAVPDDEARSVFDAACRATGVPARLLRPDAVGTPRVRARPGAVQVVHSLVVDGSLATVVLPPNWVRSASGAYPILANGLYDLNENLFRVEGPAMLRMIARSATEGRTGAIGVLWNGGGAMASRTLNARAGDQFASLMATVAREFSGDPQRIVMFGGSRGGATALMMASNPKGHPYRVTYAAVAAAPTRIGEHAQMSGPTFPGMFFGEAWSVGLDDAWRLGWRYPACAGRPHLTGKTVTEAHLHVLTGTTDPVTADAEHSPIAPNHLAGLKAAGTQVYLETGTHDGIVPYAHQVEYGLKLIELGIPLEAVVNVRAGHFGRGEQDHAWEALQAYVDPRRAGDTPRVRPGISFFRVNRASQALEPLSLPDGHYPFTLEGPRFVARGVRFPLVLVGPARASWEVSLGSFTWSGVVPPSMKSIQWIDVPPDLPTGDYEYRLRILKPGSSTWIDIPSTNSIDGSRAVVTVRAAEPEVTAADATETSRGGVIKGFEATTWGLSEY